MGDTNQRKLLTDLTFSRNFYNAKAKKFLETLEERSLLTAFFVNLYGSYSIFFSVRKL